jgi:putative DNA primase/helicase
MNVENYDDAAAQIRAEGLLLDTVTNGRGGKSIGELFVDSMNAVRCKVEGMGSEKKGWYWLSSKEIDGKTYITGAYGINVGADYGKRTIKITRDGKAVKISEEDRAAIAARQKANMARLKAMRDAEAERAALAAGSAWRKYVTEGESDYLARKRVAAHGLRFSPSGNGTVAVPMMDSAGKVWGLQLIRGKKRGTGKLEKEYWPRGLSKQGHYHLIGPIPRHLVLVAEGYATAATLHQATGLPVAVAFDAGNLQPVAQAISKTYRSAKILICADDDYLTDGNPGVTAAKNAAHAVQGAVAVPAFAADREGKKITDFNDLAEREGEATVRAQIEATLRAKGFDAPAPSARGASPRGAGERSQKDDLASIIQVDEALDRFAMIYGAGGTWFDDVEHMLVPKADLQDILPEHGMRDMRSRKRVVRLDEVGFDPAGTDRRIKCNLWGGWPTEPKAGSCKVLLELLEYLCSGEENPREIYQWVLRWLAYPIQHPGAKMRTALVFHGPQGAGKNLFFETVMAIYGEYGRIVDQSAIEDKFNDWASRKLFLIADEVVARAELYHVKNKLKGIVTGEWIRINPKNVAAHDERNHVNLVFLSNERQPLVLEKDDRRYTVIWTPEKLPEGFYGDIRTELDAGGVAALHHHLATLDLGDFSEHSKPPMTQSKRDVIDISMDSIERFVQDWQAGGITFDEALGVLPFGPCASADLYQTYGRWCKREGVFKPRESNQFVGHLAKLPRWRKALADRYESATGGKTVRTRFVIPSDESMQAAIAAGLPDKRRNAAHSQAAWLTACFFDFQQAMGDRQ